MRFRFATRGVAIGATEGYGWLPYAYVEEQLAADFWTVISDEWLDSDEFLRPRLPVLARDDDESRLV